MTKKQVTDALAAAGNLEKKLQPIFADNAPALVAPIIRSLTIHKDRIVHEELEAKKTPEQKQQEQDAESERILTEAKERSEARKALKSAMILGKTIADGELQEENTEEGLEEDKDPAGNTGDPAAAGLPVDPPKEDLGTGAAAEGQAQEPAKEDSGTGAEDLKAQQNAQSGDQQKDS
jgi:hypothetical protein